MAKEKTEQKEPVQAKPAGEPSKKQKEFDAGKTFVQRGTEKKG